MDEDEITAAVIRFLEANRRGSWSVSARPDESNQERPSPDRILTDGRVTIAVEIKSLSVQMGRRVGVIESVARRLLPSCGGTYDLDFGDSQIDELNKTEMRELKTAINQIAPSMSVGGSASLPRRRQAKAVHRTGGTCDSWPRLTCAHRSLAGFPGTPTFNGPGCVMLVDDGQPDHTFRRSDSEDRFVSQMEEVARQMAAGTMPSGAAVDWLEEAILTCVSREEHGGVNVPNLTVSAAQRPDDYARHEVLSVVPAAVAKFAGGRWADEHWIALGGRSSSASRSVANALGEMDDSELASVSTIVLITVAGTDLVYTRETESSPSSLPRPS